VAEKQLKIVTCPGARQFSQRMVKHLKRRNPHTRAVEADFPVFKNGEVKTVLKEPIRGSDVFVIQDVANTKVGSVNDNIWALYTAIDACNHASCEEVNVVIPTFPYSRQHKKTMREGLTASLFAHQLESMGVKRIVTLDIHSSEVQNAFSKTIMENLHASYQIIKKMIQDGVSFENMMVVAPDTGSISRNTFFANALKIPLAMMYKKRNYSKVTTSAADSNIESQQLIGDIDSNSVILFDDMIDSGSTILKAAAFLKERGASEIYISCSLPFFNDPATSDFDRAFADGTITRVYGTSAVYNPGLWKRPWFSVVDVTELFADVILRINEEVSLSTLLDSAEFIEELLSGESE
jgi:ribose-phosphate pyrophosphokinase